MPLDETPLSRIGALIEKMARWPKGAPGSKGGQFKEQGSGWGKLNDGPPKGAKQGVKLGPWDKQGSLFPAEPGGSKSHQHTNSGWHNPDEPGWGSKSGHSQPKPLPAGAVKHPHKNDKGADVHIHYPTKASDPATWTDPKAVATFTPGSPVPPALNGVPFAPWTPPTDTAGWAQVPGQNPQIEEDYPFEPSSDPTKASVGASVLIEEPDGRVWLTRPTNAFGGYQQTFPKGTIEPGLSLQATAIKEVYEETGLKVEITGILGDYERTTSKARIYYGRRVGGTPADMGWESQAIRLAPPEAMAKLLNRSVDQGILEDWLHESSFNKLRAAIQRVAKGYNAHQPRWPKGTALGGQWKAYDADGFTLPPKIATASNPAYQKKVDALYGLAKSVKDPTAVHAALLPAIEKDNANLLAGAKSSHVKWNAGVVQYGLDLIAQLSALPVAQAVATRVSAMWSLASGKLTLLKDKAALGGSNPGGLYADDKGQQWLVKGNLQFQGKQVSGAVSDERARNEVLAAKLTALAGAGTVDMRLVDLDGKHGAAASGSPGSLGVAGAMIDGLTKFNPANAAHLAAVQDDFAVQAWLGNWDALGLGNDNTMLKGGKAYCIDPGGALLFRAQGTPKDKGAFDAEAKDWDTMRTSAQGAPVYGKMSKAQLQASAMKLATVTDDAIRELVKTHGPKDANANKELADTLIKRRDAILKKAGVSVKIVPVAGGSVSTGTPTPAPTPPDVGASVKLGGGVAEKPKFNDSQPGAAKYYEDLADVMLAVHAKGDLAGLQALAKKANGKPSWPVDPATGKPKTINGELMAGFHSKLVLDLQGKKHDAVEEVVAGAAEVHDAKGGAWKADDAKVLQPVGGGLTPSAAWKIKANGDVATQQPLTIKALDADQIKAAFKLSGTPFKTHVSVLQMDSGAGAHNKALVALAQDAAQGVTLMKTPVPSASLPLKNALLNAMGIPVPPGHAVSHDTAEALAASFGLKTLDEYNLTEAAVAGDTAQLLATKPNTPLGIGLKYALMGSMGISGIPSEDSPDLKAAMAEKFGPVAEPAPASAAPAPSVKSKALTANEAEDAYNAVFGSEDDTEYSQTGKLLSLAQAGDHMGILGMTMSTPKGEELQSKLVLAMTQGMAQPKAPAPAPKPSMLGMTESFAEEIIAVHSGETAWSSNSPLGQLHQAAMEGSVPKLDSALTDGLTGHPETDNQLMAVHAALKTTLMTGKVPTAAPALESAPPGLDADGGFTPPAKGLNHDEALAIYNGLLGTSNANTPMPGSPIDAMVKLAVSGDYQGLRNYEPPGGHNSFSEKVQGGLLAAMKPPAAAPAATPVAPAYALGTASAPKAKVGPGPNFDAYKTKSATNPGVNIKIDTLKAAFDAGDEQAILAMNFGSNNYEQKAVKLANDALAALGSVHQVTVSQKAGSHPALLGGTGQPATVGVAPTPVPATAKYAKPAAKPKPTLADLKPDDIPSPPSVSVSSKAWKNAANNAAMKSVYDAAFTGGSEAINKLTFPELDPNTGAPTGKHLPIGQHPSNNYVGKYIESVHIALETFLNPPPPPEPLSQHTVASMKDAAAKFKAPPVTKTPKQNFGFWLALGQITDVAKLKPKAPRLFSEQEVAAGYKAYKGYSALTKTYIANVQSSGAANYAFRNNQPTYNGKSIIAWAKAAYQDATPLPVGSTLYRWQDMDDAMLKQIETADPGVVLDARGSMCASYHPTTNSGFGKHRIVIRTPDTGDAKALMSYGTGYYEGEREITTLPGQRYVLLSKKQVPSENGWGNRWEVEIMMLPSDTPEFPPDTTDPKAQQPGTYKSKDSAMSWNPKTAKFA